MNYYIDALKKYIVFNGRATRSEYWYFILFTFIATAILAIIDNTFGFTDESGQGMLTGIYSLATIVPVISALVRRLHDTGKSGWWVLIGLIPFVGSIILIIFAIKDSQPGTNAYGPYPKKNSDTTAATTNTSA